MDDYIKRSDALNASKIVYIECLYLDDEEYEEAEADDIPVVFRRDIEAIPAADVRPVVRGRWIWPSTQRDRPYCSKCLNDAFWDADYGFATENFCPNCGADMRWDGKDGKDNILL